MREKISQGIREKISSVGEGELAFDFVAIPKLINFSPAQSAKLPNSKIEARSPLDQRCDKLQNNTPNNIGLCRYLRIKDIGTLPATSSTSAGIIKMWLIEPSSKIGCQIIMKGEDDFPQMIKASPVRATKA